MVSLSESERLDGCCVCFVFFNDWRTLIVICGWWWWWFVAKQVSIWTLITSNASWESYRLFRNVDWCNFASGCPRHTRERWGLVHRGFNKAMTTSPLEGKNPKSVLILWGRGGIRFQVIRIYSDFFEREISTWKKLVKCFVSRWCGERNIKWIAFWTRTRFLQSPRIISLVDGIITTKASRTGSRIRVLPMTTVF